MLSFLVLNLNLETYLFYAYVHVHESENANTSILKKKIKGYLVLGTGEYRLFQVSLLFLFTFIFDRTAVYLSLFELDF